MSFRDVCFKLSLDLRSERRRFPGEPPYLVECLGGLVAFIHRRGAGEESK